MKTNQHHPRSLMRARAVMGVIAALAASLGGCSSETRETGDTSGGGVPSGTAFLAATRVWDDTSTTSYFHVLPSIEQGTKVDLTQAIEVAGSAKLYSSEGMGWFAIGGGDAPTISRYTLDERGALAKGETINLQPLGVQDLWPSVYFVSPTKAYYPDRAGTQLIVWNPTTMEVQGKIDLPQTAREGYLSLYGYTPILRGKSLLFSVGWFDWVTNDTILGETGLVVIDTEKDTVLRYDVDARCGGISQSIETASGDAYFVSSALAGMAHRLGRLPTEPCALRVPKDTDTFDSSYVQHLGDLMAGAIAGEPMPGGGDTLLLRGFDEGLAMIAPDSKTWDLTGQQAWRWWQWNTAENTAAPISELTPGKADVLWFQVDGRIYGAETTEDDAETTLIDLTAEGGPKRALTIPGFLHGVAKVR